jgi:hypothetical protein
VELLILYARVQFYTPRASDYRLISKTVDNRKTENRNDPDLVQAFLKKWWVESDFKAPNLPLSLRLKVSGCHYNSITILEQNR